MQIFAKSTTGSSSGLGSLNQGLEDVEDLVERLHQAEVTSTYNPPAPSLPVLQLAEANKPDAPPTSCTRSLVSDGTPAPGQMEQSPMQACTTDQAEELNNVADDHNQNVAARPKRQSQPIRKSKTTNNKRSARK